MQRVSIEFEDINITDLDYISVNFKDGRPTMTKTTTRPDENGKTVTVSTIMPYESEKPDRKSFAKKVEK